MRRGATTVDLGLPTHEPRPFHVNERLTKSNRSLFGKVREKGRALQWKHIWSKEGRIYAHKNDSSNIHIVREEGDIERVFKFESDAKHL